MEVPSVKWGRLERFYKRGNRILNQLAIVVLTVNSDALQVVAEMLRTFVAESAARAGQQAQVNTEIYSHSTISG